MNAWVVRHDEAPGESDYLSGVRTQLEFGLIRQINTAFASAAAMDQKRISVCGGGWVAGWLRCPTHAPAINTILVTAPNPIVRPAPILTPIKLSTQI